MQNNLFLCYVLTLCTLRPSCAVCLSVLTTRETFLCKITGLMLQGEGKYPSKTLKVTHLNTPRSRKQKPVNRKMSYTFQNCGEMEFSVVHAIFTLKIHRGIVPTAH